MLNICYSFAHFNDIILIAKNLYVLRWVLCRVYNPGFTEPENPGYPGIFQTRKPGFGLPVNPGFSGLNFYLHSHACNMLTLLTLLIRITVQGGGYRRLSRCGEIPNCNHPEWNGDVRVKRQTRLWSRVGILYRYLLYLLVYLLIIPPSSVDAERAFSAAGVLCTKVRSRLSDKSIDTLRFLCSYYQKNIETVRLRAVGSDWYLT